MTEHGNCSGAMPCHCQCYLVAARHHDVCHDDCQLRSEINLNKLQGLLVPYNGVHCLGARPFWHPEMAFIVIISATTVIRRHILNLWLARKLGVLKEAAEKEKSAQSGRGAFMEEPEHEHWNAAGPATFYKDWINHRGTISTHRLTWDDECWGT